ncbi:hypothetical protein GE21DRAFT_1191007, partial [Neurospora crassa]
EEASKKDDQLPVRYASQPQHKSLVKWHPSRTPLVLRSPTSLEGCEGSEVSSTLQRRRSRCCREDSGEFWASR